MFLVGRKLRIGLNVRVWIRLSELTLSFILGVLWMCRFFALR